jgi:diguanylate cyclase (GGDEF)-like protein
VAWETLIQPGLRDQTSIGNHLITAAYPVMDLVLLTAVASLALSESRSLPAYRYLLGGVSLLLVGDLIYASVADMGTSVDRAWFNGLWLISFVLLGAAAIHPSAGRHADVNRPAKGLGSVRAAVLSLALLASPVVLVLQGSDMDPADGPVVLGIFTLVMVLVLARLWGLLADKDRDLAERAYQAVHDPLTGLPNRTLFLDRLDHALARSRRTNELLAVIFLDVDHFKLVNDSAGHHVGDEVLKNVAERLVGAVRAADTVARFAGDEFTILCEGLDAPAAAVEISDRIMAALEPALPLPEHDLHMSASLGIAVGGGRADSRNGSAMMRDADTAMYQAKLKGRGRHEIFDEAMRIGTVARLETEDALRRALDEHQLVLHYQPEISLATGEVFGVEALVRWEHPERGLVPPMDFLPVAEETGLIVPIGRWVLHEACAQARRWMDLGGGAPTVAVNLSARQLGRPDLADDVAAAIEAAGISGSQLFVEVTESALLEDTRTARNTLLRLKSLGVSVAMDDFGTGYSSLSHLRVLPVDIVKIDRSFVEGLGRTEDETNLVGAIVGMAKALGLTTIAEGVETPLQAALLTDMGCDIAQGYLFGRPTPAQELVSEAVPSATR